MSDQKRKDEESGIQFFRIDREGDIAPAFPRQPNEPAAPPSLGDAENFERMEPIFQQEPTGTNAIAASPPLDNSNNAVQKQLEKLQPQVETIARISSREELTDDQVDTLRKYISLKESEARDLKEQQRQYQSFLKKVTSQLDQVNRRHRDLLAELEVTKRREEKAREEAREIKARAVQEQAVLRNDYEDRIKRSGNVEADVQDLERKREEWKERVREELKRIKLKERELENKHELLKRDTQALLDSKDKHVLELKKKNDALEFEMETLESRLRRGNVVLSSIDQKKKRLIETMRLAITLLEQLDATSGQDDDNDLSPKGE